MAEHPYLQALKGEIPSRVPVWFMRQAGRFLPEYRAVRADHSFETMLHSPELIAEVTLQPVRRLEVDAAILFSDILLLPEVLGMDLRYIEGKGPVFGEALRDVSALRPFEPERLDFLAAGVRAIVAASPVPLIGFAGTPWTVALYMVEGQHGRDFLNARRMLFAEPGRFEAILEAITEATIEYLMVQIDAGARAIQLFDSWGGLLDAETHLRVAHPRTERIVRALHERAPGVPVVLFSRGTGAFLPRILAATEADAVNPDWTVDLAALRADPSCPRALQGNLDPAWFFAPASEAATRARELITRAGVRGLVFNGGHGMNPLLDPAPVKEVIEAIHDVDTGAP
jgi:uroporphyrinogen decarboxylase